LNITISPIHLEEVVSENVKRGRPKSEKVVKETTGKKGRPKKEKKSVEVNAEEEEDLFATLISNANANQPLVQPLEKVEPNEEAKEESTDLVAPAVEKVEKKSKKVKETDPAKEAEKLKKAEEKIDANAKKEEAKIQAILDADQAKKDAASAAVSGAQNNNATKTDTLAQINSLKSLLAQLAIDQRETNLLKDPVKKAEDQKAIDGRLQTIVQTLEKSSDLVQKAL
jgi:hypothetical protein